MDLELARKIVEKKYRVNGDGKVRTANPIRVFDFCAMMEDYHQAKLKNFDLAVVSKRSELLKAESPERSYDQYLKKYFELEPTTELIYRQKFNGKRMAEKDIIKMYLQAHCLL